MSKNLFNPSPEEFELLTSIVDSGPLQINQQNLQLADNLVGKGILRVENQTHVTWNNANIKNTIGKALEPIALQDRPELQGSLELLMANVFDKENFYLGMLLIDLDSSPKTLKQLTSGLNALRPLKDKVDDVYIFIHHAESFHLIEQRGGKYHITDVGKNSLGEFNSYLSKKTKAA